jgi:small subunit ribosomal protein S20
MANRRAAVKRQRVDKKRTSRNSRIKRDIKKNVKEFLGFITAKNNDEAKKSLNKVSSLLDKAAKKNVIHANKAARDKSRLAQKISKTA